MKALQFFRSELTVLLQDRYILLEAGITEGVGALEGGELILERVLEANQAISSVLHNNYKDQDRSFYSFSAIIYRSISLLISFSESCTAYSWTGPGDYCKV